MRTFFTQPEYRRIAYIGLAIQVLAALCSIGYNHPDEQWQVMEFASYKLGFSPAADLPWEFREQIRQAWQPWIVFLLGKALLALNLYNPFTLALILRLLTALFSYAVALQLITVFLDPSDRPVVKTALWLTCFLWFMPYVRTHFNSETLSGMLFFGGLVVLLRTLRQPDGGKWGPIFLSGLLMGGAFESRFQIAFAILATAIWLLVFQRPTFGQALVGILGFLLVLGIGVLIDHWFYGNWVFTPYRYYEVNILQDKASNWGRSPFWYYPVMVAEAAAPPLSVFLLLGVFFALVVYPRHLLSWVIILMTLGHSAVAHKEVRFLFPLIFALPVVLAMFWHHQRWQNVLRSIPHWLQRAALYLLLIENIGLLIFATIKPAHESVASFSYIYHYAQNQPIDIYTLDSSPFFWSDLAVNFYRPPNARVIQVASADSLVLEMNRSEGRKKLFFYEGFAFEDKYPEVARHFQSQHKTIPEWLKYFNVNNWLSRARVWSLYELTSSNPKNQVAKQ
jgi:phosphatidylinositol glycan class B